MPQASQRSERMSFTSAAVSRASIDFSATASSLFASL